jgi:uncharacterized protein YbjQ (UPF0145 family)
LFKKVCGSQERIDASLIFQYFSTDSLGFVWNFQSVRCSKSTEIDQLKIFAFRGQLMIITTTDVIQGAEIQSYLGIVTAEVVYGTNVLRDFFAGIRDIIGGRTGSYEEVFLKGQRDALAELEKRAGRLGANAVIGVEVDTGTINVDSSGALLLITAVGTAVRVR